jgi:outer membrane protein TolC
VQTLVDEGEEKASAAIFNEQLRAERRLKVLDARRKLQQAAIQLSLFLRDDQGIPIVPADAWLPWAFPAPSALPAEDVMEEVARALTQRPELALLDLQAQEQRLDLQLANNQLLPELDFLVDGSQDMGPAATSSRDKGEFEMEAGVLASVPLPRNKARGKITSTRGKLQQIAIKRQFQMQKIEVELRKARVALELAKQRVDAAIEAFDLAMRYLALEQRSYAEGESNLIDLNILESKAFENRLLLIDALQDWYIALAMLQNAMGIDPLDASMPVTMVTPETPVQQAPPESIDTPPRVNSPANNGPNP